MANALRLKNNNYINSDSIVHDRKLLSNILRNEYHKKEKRINVNGWYRIARISDNQINLLLSINTLWFYNPPSSVYFSILTIYQNAKISQLNALTFPNSTPSITKLRVQYDNTTRYYYVDVYYTPNSANQISVKCENRNDLDSIEILEPTIPLIEYTTVDEITITY